MLASRWTAAAKASNTSVLERNAFRSTLDFIEAQRHLTQDGDYQYRPSISDLTQQHPAGVSAFKISPLASGIGFSQS